MNIHEQRILIVDFGSQYTQLIARRIRELGVYCELHPFDISDEQIKKFALLDAAWEPVKADGSESELTPTMKLKRRVILEKFQDKIEGMYNDN